MTTGRINQVTIWSPKGQTSEEAMFTRWGAAKAIPSWAPTNIASNGRVHQLFKADHWISQGVVRTQTRQDIAAKDRDRGIHPPSGENHRCDNA